MPDAKGTLGSNARLVSLDQFRGYTVFGMILVNFVSGYRSIAETIPLLHHHNTYCSYADTIMPQFFFAVGFGYRMSFLHRQSKEGLGAAWKHALYRNGILLLLGFIVHQLTIPYRSFSELQALGGIGWIRTAFHRDFFQALTHIAVTSIWILPVIHSSMRIRWLAMMGTALLFGFLSYSGYDAWVWENRCIDGGPLGFLSWSIPMLLGSIAYDLYGTNRAIRNLLGVGLGIAFLGILLSTFGILTRTNLSAWLHISSWEGFRLPFQSPVLPRDIWSMSQRGVTLPYTVFGAGWSMIGFAILVWLCDRKGWQLPLFRLLGKNALAAYILHILVLNALVPVVPKDSPFGLVAMGYMLSMLLIWILMRHLDQHKLILKL